MNARVADVVLAATNEDSLTAVATGLRDLDVRIEIAPVDVADRQACFRLVA